MGKSKPRSWVIRGIHDFNRMDLNGAGRIRYHRRLKLQKRDETRLETSQAFK